MSNRQLLPFERNRYFMGKMLASADFEVEQNYMNNKRRFMNNVMYGEGIVCGLEVSNLDDLSIMIESGVAIDNEGHEIVLEKSLVKKLSAINGFEELTTNQATLCIKYSEENVQPVYSRNKNDAGNTQFNHVLEGNEIILLDSLKADNNFCEDELFLTKGILFEDEDYKVTLELPQVVSKGKKVKIVCKVDKLSNNNSKLDYSCILQTPDFVNNLGQHETEIQFDDITIETKGESIINEYWFMVENTNHVETAITLKTGTAVARVNDKYANTVDSLSININISELEPRKLVARMIGCISLEQRENENRNAWIKLANINIEKNGTAYIITGIEQDDIKKYIQTPAEIQKNDIYMDYFTDAPTVVKQEVLAVNEQKNVPAYKSKKTGLQVSAGTLEIPLGDRIRKGDIRYSGEIMHGLGKGKVYIEIGYESMEEDKMAGEQTNSTIFGNPGLFADDDKTIASMETAVKVYNDKGSFVVAAKLMREVDFSVMTYQWIAIKFPEENDTNNAGSDAKDKSIQAENPTVVLAPGESYRIDIKYNNMDRCGVIFEMSENGSGVVTADGVYTAPNKEGVYEIKIYCASNPEICAYAYAIVKNDFEPKANK